MAQPADARLAVDRVFLRSKIRKPGRPRLPVRSPLRRETTFRIRRRSTRKKLQHRGCCLHSLINRTTSLRRRVLVANRNKTLERSVRTSVPFSFVPVVAVLDFVDTTGRTTSVLLERKRPLPLPPPPSVVRASFVLSREYCMRRCCASENRSWCSR
jgi:hypothetical protein